MSDAIRRLFNRVEMALDRRALRTASHENRQLGGDGAPQIVSVAFAPAWAAATERDAAAELKMIAAPEGTNSSGEAVRWEFFFDLPGRMAKLRADWFLPWNAAGDRFAPPELNVHIDPFPSENNALRRAAVEGKLLYRQLQGEWRRETQRVAALPVPFRDFASALDEAVAGGLAADDEEFSVATGLSPAGEPSWIVASRQSRYFLRFA